jgi:hypothetical protein
MDDERSSHPEFDIWLRKLKIKLKFRKAAEDKRKSRHSRKHSNLNNYLWKYLRPMETQDQDEISEDQALLPQSSQEVVQGEYNEMSSIEKLHALNYLNSRWR